MICTENKFKLTPIQVKHRLTTIIDNRLQNVIAQLDKNKNAILVLNQSLLEQWAALIDSIVYLKDQKQLPSKALNAKILKNSINSLMQKTQITAPLKRQQTQSNYLLNINANSIDVYSIAKNISKDSAWTFQHQKLNFKKGLVRKYSSYNFYDPHNVILIGGSRQQNPNLKSNQIFNLSLTDQQIVKIAELPEGVSSHATVKIGHFIYIIGGNKDLNIVTRSCYKFNIVDKSVTNVAALNFASASHTAVCWKNQFIYKIGGVGSCFGQWDLSPYIERYSVQVDEWKVVNPILSINEKMLDAYSLLVNSLAYQSTKNSIVIVGGVDFNQQPSNKMIQITIKQESSDGHQQPTIIHEITKLGIVEKLKPGAFLQQQCISWGTQITALQTIYNQSQGICHQVVKIDTKISYL